MTPKKSAASPSASASIAWPCSNTASMISRCFSRTTCASCASSHERTAAHRRLSTFNCRLSTSDMTFADAKQRFSNRVADYARYRPGYPPAVLDLLRTECGLRPGHVIADIGSGTGLLSELLLKNGNRVFGVEPNEAMRQAGEEHLASYDGFTSVNGSAEATTLLNASVELVTAAQAFHWFEPRDLPNYQILDWEGFRGRLRSSSFAPTEGHPNYAPMMAELERIFRAHQCDGRVRMEYFTRIYFGRLERR